MPTGCGRHRVHGRAAGPGIPGANRHDIPCVEALPDSVPAVERGPRPSSAPTGRAARTHRAETTHGFAAVRAAPRSVAVRRTAGPCCAGGRHAARRSTPSTCRTDGGRTSQATRAGRRSRAGLRRCAGCHAGNPSRCRVSGGPSPSLLLQERPGGQPGRRQGEPVGEHETGCPPHPGAGEAWDGPHGPRRAPTWLDCRRYSAADPGDRVLAAVVARAGTEALSRSPGPLPPCPPPAERGGTHHLAEGGDQP
jgi:hypothetical protein